MEPATEARPPERPAAFFAALRAFCAVEDLEEARFALFRLELDDEGEDDGWLSYVAFVRSAVDWMHC